MMKAELMFRIMLDYDKTAYAPLMKLATKKYWDRDFKKYVWEFDVKDVDKVTAILAKSIEFTEPEAKIVFERSPSAAQKEMVGAYRGLGSFEWTVTPQKIIIETTIDKKKNVVNIPLSTVQACWDAIKKQPVNKVVNSSTVWKKYCDHLGITRFNRDSGTFDSQKFQGDRKTYLPWNFSMRFLNEQGYVRYGKGAKGVTRIKEKFDVQTYISK